MARPRTLAEWEELTGDEELTDPERYLIKFCQEGKLCDLGEERPDAPDPARTIRAELLRYLILGGCDGCKLDEAGVQLWGAYIPDRLILDFATAKGQTSLVHCHFAAGISALQTGFQLLNLTGSWTSDLNAQGVEVKGSVVLRDGFAAKGEVSLCGAKIGGQLNCERGNFENQSGNALNAQSAEVTGDVFLSDTFKATGTVRISGATIGGQFNCDKSIFLNVGGIALNAQGIRVTGDVFLNEGFSSRGLVTFSGASIGGQLACIGANFSNDDDDAFNAQGIEVSDAIFFRSGFAANGKVCLTGAKIGGQLDCSEATFTNNDGDALRADRMRMRAHFIWRDVKVNAGLINLASTHVGDLVDDLTSWPKSGQLILDGFTYDRIGAAFVDAPRRRAWLQKGTVWNGELYPQPYYQLAKVLGEMGHRRDQRKILVAAVIDIRKHQRHRRRLRRKFTRSLLRLSGKPGRKNAEKLQKGLEQLPADMHQQAEAWLKTFAERHLKRPALAHPLKPPSLSPIDQFFARRDFRNRMRSAILWDRLFILRNHIMDHSLRLIVGYGYGPFRSMLWLAGFWAVTTTLATLAWEEGSFAPNSDVILVSSDWTDLADDPLVTNPAADWSADKAPGQDWETFNRYAYGFDVVVPILTLGQTDAWAPSTTRGRWGWHLWWARWVLSSLGWIVTALGAAAITGIIRRE